MNKQEYTSLLETVLSLYANDLIEEVESWDNQLAGDDEGNQYSVKDLYAHAQKKGPAVEIPIESTDALEWWDKSYSMDNPDHVTRMKNANTSYPVLAIEYEKGKYSIADGLNRIKKAHSMEGKKTIYAHIMSQDEMKEVGPVKSVKS